MMDIPARHSADQAHAISAQWWNRLPPPARLRVAATAICLLGAAGGMLDAWSFIDHGGIFATAQTGNVVMFAISLAAGRLGAAAQRLPSLAAFVLGLLLSRVVGVLLKRRGTNSRTPRLIAEATLLVALAPVADRLPDGVVTASVACLGAVQMTSLSHIGTWSFSTALTTGNLTGAISNLVRAESEPHPTDPARHAVVLGSLCAAFATGAVAGGVLAPRWHAATLVAAAALVLVAALVVRRAPDPLPPIETPR